MMNDPFEDFYGRRQRLALGGGGSQGLSPFGMTDPFQRMNEMMREMVGNLIALAFNSNNYKGNVYTVLIVWTPFLKRCHRCRGLQKLTFFRVSLFHCTL